MTPDELKQLCQSKWKKPLDFAAAFSELDEATRKSLSKTAQDIYRDARKVAGAAWTWSPTRLGTLARVALLAVGPWSQAERNG